MSREWVSAERISNDDYNRDGYETSCSMGKYAAVQSIYHTLDRRKRWATASAAVGSAENKRKQSSSSFLGAGAEAFTGTTRVGALAKASVAEARVGGDTFLSPNAQAHFLKASATADAGILGAGVRAGVTVGASAGYEGTPLQVGVSGGPKGSAVLKANEVSVGGELASARLGKKYNKHSQIHIVQTQTHLKHTHNRSCAG